MTMAEKHRLFMQGRDYWHQYIKINGFSMNPTSDGLKALSRNLDVNIPHLQQRINFFLEA